MLSFYISLFGSILRNILCFQVQRLLPDSRWDAGEISRSTLLPHSKVLGVALGFSRTQDPFKLWLLSNASAFSQALGIRGPRSSENSNFQRCQAVEITAFLNLGTTNYSHRSIYALLRLAPQSLSETDGQLRFPKVTQILRSPTHTGSQYQLIF